MSSQLVWFELPVADVDRGQKFFSGLMGWDFHSWDGQPYHMVQGAEPGGAMLPGEGPPVVYFSTEDIDAAVAKVGELGGTAQDIQEVPGVGRMSACRDDQGTPFSLYQPAA